MCPKFHLATPPSVSLGLVNQGESAAMAKPTRIYSTHLYETQRRYRSLAKVSKTLVPRGVQSETKTKPHTQCTFNPDLDVVLGEWGTSGPPLDRALPFVEFVALKTLHDDFL